MTPYLNQDPLEWREAGERLHALIERETGMETRRKLGSDVRRMLCHFPEFGVLYDPVRDPLTHNVIDQLERNLDASEDVRDRFIAAYCPSTVWFDRGGIGGVVVKAGNEARGYRVLSAGCSRGSELYSIAIALLEAGIEITDGSLVGVDVNQKAISQARSGVYTTEEFDHPWNNLPEDLRTKYFSREGGIYVASDTLVESVEFQRCNLVDPEQVAAINDEPFDVVLCRNVLKYFEEKNGRQIVRNLGKVLKPGGFFFKGTDINEEKIEYLGEEGFEEVNSWTYRKTA